MLEVLKVLLLAPGELSELSVGALAAVVVLVQELLVIIDYVDLVVVDDAAILIVVVIFLPIEYLLLLVLRRLGSRGLLLTGASRACRASSLMILKIVLDFSFEFDIELLPDHIADFIGSQFGICVAVVDGANMRYIFLIHLLLFFFVIVHADFCVQVVQELVLVGAAAEEARIAFCIVEAVDVVKTSIEEWTARILVHLIRVLAFLASGCSTFWRIAIGVSGAR